MEDPVESDGSLPDLTEIVPPPRKKRTNFAPLPTEAKVN